MFVKSVEHLVVQRTASIPQQTTALSFTFKLNGSIKIMQRYTLIVAYASTSTSWKYTPESVQIWFSMCVPFRFLSIITQLSEIHEKLVHEDGLNGSWTSSGLIGSGARSPDSNYKVWIILYDHCILLYLHWNLVYFIHENSYKMNFVEF